jgi:hypothetical protein
MTKLTDAQIKQATEARIAQALKHVHAAQNELSRAREMLSALEYACPEYRKAGTLYDRVHDFWYVVDGLRHKRRVRLDRTNISALEQRMPGLTDPEAVRKVTSAL